MRQLSLHAALPGGGGTAGTQGALGVALPPAIGSRRISGLGGSFFYFSLFLHSDFLEEIQLPDMELVVLPTSGGDDFRIL